MYERARNAAVVRCSGSGGRKVYVGVNTWGETLVLCRSVDRSVELVMVQSFLQNKIEIQLLDVDDYSSINGSPHMNQTVAVGGMTENISSHTACSFSCETSICTDSEDNRSEERTVASLHLCDNVPVELGTL